MHHAHAGRELVLRFIATGKVFAELEQRRFRVRLTHALLPVVWTVIWQNGNEVVCNTFHPSVVNDVSCMRVSDFELQPVSRIEKHLVVKFVTVGINAGDDVVIIFLELVGHRFASAAQFSVPKIVQKLLRMRMAAHSGKRDFVISRVIAPAGPVVGKRFRNQRCWIGQGEAPATVYLSLPIRSDSQPTEGDNT